MFDSVIKFLMAVGFETQSQFLVFIKKRCYKIISQKVNEFVNYFIIKN